MLRNIIQNTRSGKSLVLTDYFAKYTATAKISTPKLNSFDIDYDRRTIQIYASESFAYQPFLPETVETIYNQMKELLPGPVNYYQITIYADGKPIEELVPNLYRSKKKDKERMALNTEYKGAPWVKNTSRPNEISRGLQDRHIALWQSHGNYYKNDKGEWGWQRPRLFCTTDPQEHRQERQLRNRPLRSFRAPFSPEPPEAGPC